VPNVEWEDDKNFDDDVIKQSLKILTAFQCESYKFEKEHFTSNHATFAKLNRFLSSGNLFHITVNCFSPVFVRKWKKVLSPTDLQTLKILKPHIREIFEYERTKSKFKVLTHGDWRLCNIIWREKNGESKFQSENAVVIDWAQVHIGSAVSELARFLVEDLTSNIRKQKEMSYLMLYKKLIRKRFKKEFNKDFEEVFDISENDWLTDYKIGIITKQFVFVIAAGFTTDTDSVDAKSCEILIKKTFKALEEHKVPELVINMFEKNKNRK